MENLNMDAFGEDSFEPRQWVNKALEAHVDGGQQALLERCQGILVALKEAEERVDAAWQSVVSESVDLMPALCTTLCQAEQCVAELSDCLRQCRSNAAVSSISNAQTVQQMARLHRAKLNLQALKTCIADSNQWTALKKQIETVFSTGDCATIAQHIGLMQRCLEGLAKSHDVVSKRHYLDDVKDQFVSMISPSVIGAFASQSQDRLAYFTTIFDELRRQADLDRLLDEYMKQQLTNAWQEVSGQPASTQRPSQSFANLRKVVCDSWLVEMRQLSTCLPMADELVARALESALHALQPTVQSMLVACKEHNYQPNEWLVDTERCLDEMQRTLDVVRQRVNGSPSASLALTSCLGRLVVPLFQGYSKDETSHLSEQVNKLQDEHVTWAQFGQHLLHQADVFDAVERTIARGRRLYGPFALPAVCKAVDVTLNNYASHVKRTLATLLKEKSTAAEYKNANRHICRMLSTINFLGKVQVQADRLVNRLTGQAEELGGALRDDQWSTETVGQMVGDDLATRAACDECLKSVGFTLPNFTSAWQALRKSTVHQVVERILKPIEHILSTLPTMAVWCNQMEGGLQSELPEFGFMAQEYVTFVGHYLITLARDLEPLLTEQNADFNAAFQGCALPHLEPTDDHWAKVLLHCSSRGAAVLFVRTVRAVTKWSTYGRKQLLADAGYLCNVLDDLAVSVPEQLTTLLVSFKEQLERQSK